MTAQYRDSAAAADNDQYRKVCTRKRLPQGFVQVGFGPGNLDSAMYAVSA